MPRQLYILDKPLSWFGEDESAQDLATQDDLLQLIIERARHLSLDAKSNGKRDYPFERRKISLKPAGKKCKPAGERQGTRADEKARA